MSTRKSLKSNTKRREVRSKAGAAPAAPKSKPAPKSKAKSAAKVKTKSVSRSKPKASPRAKPASRAKSAASPQPKPTSRAKSKPAPKSKAKTAPKSKAKTAAKVGTKAKPASRAKSKPDRPVKPARPTQSKPRARSRSKAKPKLAVKAKIQDQEELARAGAHVDQATIDSATANLNPGPRMQQILQAEIAPWQRDSVSDEEAQLRELNRIPVRHVFDSDEARRRLVDRAATPGKKRFARSKATSTSSSSS